MMSEFLKTVIIKSASKWRENLKKQVKRREESSLKTELKNLCKMPKKRKIIVEFLGLFKDGIKVLLINKAEFNAWYSTSLGEYL